MPAVDVSRMSSAVLLKTGDDDSDGDAGNWRAVSDGSQAGSCIENKCPEPELCGARGPSSLASAAGEPPTGSAQVGRYQANDAVSALRSDPRLVDNVVNLEAVVNVGTYSVPEDFPLSKAVSEDDGR